MIMLGLEKMIRASTFTLHFALCFYHFLILNSLMSLFGVGTWLLYELVTFLVYLNAILCFFSISMSLYICISFFVRHDICHFPLRHPPYFYGGFFAFRHEPPSAINNIDPYHSIALESWCLGGCTLWCFIQPFWSDPL